MKGDDGRMKGDDGHIQELIQIAIACQDSNAKIEPLKKILTIKCDEQLNILIGQIITYFQW